MKALCADNGGDPERTGKKDPLDPLLWRAHRPGEPAWPSPFGPGRPGWHVECAAIARRYLGDTIDIQGGGRDLTFPHHECTAAIAAIAAMPPPTPPAMPPPDAPTMPPPGAPTMPPPGVQGDVVPFASAFVHSGMVSLGGQKMSKSLGNIELVSRLRAAGVEPMAIRLALLAHHYRQDWEWTPAVLDAATHRLAAWRAAASAPTGPDALPLLENVRRHLADDLDTPAALAAVDRWVHATAIGDGAGASTVPSTATSAGPDAPAAFRSVADALLGIDLGPVRAGGK
jgi:L-cysteine:1D-myo-inositol 2-amino-2-deoxy-alpha-D-glucopyranoside ligase